MIRFRMTAILSALSLAASLLLAASQPGDAAATRSSSFHLFKLKESPPIDGDFTTGVWAQALHVDDFTETSRRSRAAMQTDAYVLYDDKNLYVGFRCNQRLAKITDTRNITDVQSGSSDFVEVDIDPSGIGARTYTFDATPGGFRFQYSSESVLYLPQWGTTAGRDADGYWAILVVPFHILRGQETSTQDWRINLVRHIAALNESYSWSFDPKASSVADATTWPLIAGLALSRNATKPLPHGSIFALGSGGPDRRIFEGQAGVLADASPRFVGIDATVPVTSTTALVATVNPDFSNVEQDQTVIAPQQFQRQYREYRPFFSQGAPFLTPLPTVALNAGAEQAFYSPSIGIFDSGLKIEGTQGRNSFGLLDAQGSGFNDAALGFQNARPDNSLATSFQSVDANHGTIHDETIGVGVQRRNIFSGETTIADFMNESGTLVTAPASANYYEILEGVESQKIFALAGYRHVGAEFAPIDGYTAVNDISGPEAVLSYNGAGGEKGSVKTYSASVEGDRYLGENGDVHLADVLASVSLTTKKLISYSASLVDSEQKTFDSPYPLYTNPRDLRFDQGQFGLGFGDGTPSPIDLSYSFGQFAVACFDNASSLCDGTAGGFVPAYVQQLDASTTRHIGRFYTVTGEYGAIRERSDMGLPSDGQTLRRLSVSRGIGFDSSVSLQLRSISGTGGFSTPGTNFSVGLHVRQSSGNELYVNYGSPSANATINRYVVKYIFYVGGGAGT